jgi:hypothetical protein
MELRPFSPKQRTVLRWWCDPAYKDYDAVICDGAVRSGKTAAMSLGFVLWGIGRFPGGDLALCGKTITSLERNVVRPLCSLLRSAGFTVRELFSKRYFETEVCGRVCRFYLFGGKDEGSAALIQGMTLCGVLFDEAALMPRSFVEQAIARCSVSGGKIWFNCNPEHPYHWFYREWIRKAEEKRALYLHFTMDDNPSLSPEVRARYERMYSGVFYDRFIRGLWTVPEGLVYPMFSRERFVVSKLPERFIRYVIFDTWVAADSSRLTRDGRPYAALKASAYMIRTRSNEDLIREIDGGIKKEVSVSCSAGRRICSVCGADRSGQGCVHLPGHLYDGKLCHTVLDHIRDAYEWSFVAVPAQVNAGVTKRFHGEEEQEMEKEQEILMQEVEEMLRGEVLSLCGRKGAVSKALCLAAEKMALAELMTMKRALLDEQPCEADVQLAEKAADTQLDAFCQR